MNKFVMVVFADEKSAYEGVHALQELHNEGSISLYASAVVYREASGKLTIKQQVDPGPLGLGVGALVGGLVGLFGGPLGAVVGMAGGGLVGSWRDFIHAEVSDEFMDVVQRELVAGKSAVLAELSEEWTTPVDVRMEKVGGLVVREPRAEFVDELIEKRVDALKRDLAQRKAERASAKAQRMRSGLENQLQDAEKKLDQTLAKARARLEKTKEELDAKINALEEQAANATPETREQIQKRLVELRGEETARMAKLDQAYAIAQQAVRA